MERYNRPLFIFTTRHIPSERNQEPNSLFHFAQPIKGNLVNLKLFHFLKAPNTVLRNFLQEIQDMTSFWQEVHQYFLGADEGYRKYTDGLFIKEAVQLEEKVNYLVENSDDEVNKWLISHFNLIQDKIYEIPGELIFGRNILKLHRPQMQFKFISALVGDVLLSLNKDQREAITDIKLLLHAKELGAGADDRIVRSSRLIAAIEQLIHPILAKRCVPFAPDKPKQPDEISFEFYAFKHTPESHVNELLRMKPEKMNGQTLNDWLNEHLKRHPYKK